MIYGICRSMPGKIFPVLDIIKLELCEVLCCKDMSHLSKNKYVLCSYNLFVVGLFPLLNGSCSPLQI